MYVVFLLTSDHFSVFHRKPDLQTGTEHFSTEYGLTSALQNASAMRPLVKVQVTFLRLKAFPQEAEH